MGSYDPMTDPDIIEREFDGLKPQIFEGDDKSLFMIMRQRAYECYQDLLEVPDEPVQRPESIPGWYRKFA